MVIAPQNATILIVEDNPDNMRITVELLEDLEVAHVDGRVAGWQLFRMLRTTPLPHVHLILLDLQIPGEDGFGVLKRIRATPELKDVLVVAVTANVSVRDVNHARQAGFDGFIGKPLCFERFPQQITRILAGESIWEPH